MVVIPAESSSPESEHAVETDDLVDTDVPAFQVTQNMAALMTDAVINWA